MTLLNQEIDKEEKQMKKLIALLLVLAMALSLAACGGSSAPKADAPAAEPVVSESGKTVHHSCLFT